MKRFSLFDQSHIIWLALTAVVIAVILVIGRRTEHLVRFLGVTALLLHLLESGFRIVEGSYGIDTLPLHICAITSYLVFVHCLWPHPVIGEILFCPGIAGALCALLSPDWTDYAPFSLLSIAGFLSHIAIIAYVLYALRIRLITPSVRKWHIPALFLAVYAAVMIPFDRHFGVNYGFLNAPSPGSILVPLAQISGGKAAYYVGYGLLAACGIAVCYGLYALVTKERT